MLWLCAVPKTLITCAKAVSVPASIFVGSTASQIWSVRIIASQRAARLHTAWINQGTRIDTIDGVKPIEELQSGNRVKGISGWREVKWIGWRTFGAAAFRTEKYRAAHCPVTIKAHALDGGMPAKDIRVSSWHHLFVDGLLVRAMDLVNGLSIIQDLSVREVSYYYVKLDQFDVILAHDIYTESWADGGKRDFFQNVDVTMLKPEERERRLAKRPGFTVVRPGETRLTAIQDHLFSRAIEFAAASPMSRAA